jgi:hypothetical protein
MNHLVTPASSVRRAVLVAVGIAATSACALAQLSPPPPGAYPQLNAAAGENALASLLIGDPAVVFPAAWWNVASGWLSMAWLQSGQNNIALGGAAGSWLGSGDNNIYLGTANAFPGEFGTISESGTIRIGDLGGAQTRLFLAGVGLAPTGRIMTIQPDGLVSAINDLPVVSEGTAVVIGADGTFGKLPGLQGPAGPQGPQGNPGVAGAQGPAGVGFVPGAVLMLKKGTPAPAGFTRLGVLKSDLEIKKSRRNNDDNELEVEVYLKN